MIDKVRGGLRHVPAIAGRANPAPLARERDDKPLAAARAEGTAEPKAEDAALEIPESADSTARAEQDCSRPLFPPRGRGAGGANRSTPQRSWGKSLHPLERIAPALGHFFPIRARFGVWHGMCIHILA